MISFGIRTTRYQVKSLCASQRRGFWLIIDSLWLKQFNFRVSVGFGRLMVGNSTSADFVILSAGMPRCFSSETIKSALDWLNESLMPDVPVELSAAPVTLTCKSYFFATLANSSRLSFCETSVRRAVLRVKRNIQELRYSYPRHDSQPWDCALQPL